MLDNVILGIIIGTLAAIVYSLRVLILLERRIARMDLNIEAMTQRILREEAEIEAEERLIEKKIGIKTTPRKTTSRKTTAKKTITRKAAPKKTVTKKTATRKSRK